MVSDRQVWTAERLAEAAASLGYVAQLDPQRARVEVFLPFGRFTLTAGRNLIESTARTAAEVQESNRIIKRAGW